MLHTPSSRHAFIMMATVVALLVGADLPAAASPARAAIYDAAVATTGRSDKDRERDAREKPADVLAFAGFRPGMRIADIFGGGGYYSELLAALVGPKGHVVLLNNPAYARFAAEDLESRFKDGRMASIERSVVANEDLKLGRASLDGALFVMSYHDLYFSDPKDFPAIDAPQFLAQLHRALKPGARLLIVDHAAATGSGSAPAQSLHRIDEAFADRDLESHGFRRIATFDGLRSAADDHSTLVFDPAIRGRTDRFVHLYERR